MLDTRFSLQLDGYYRICLNGTVSRKEVGIYELLEFRSDSGPSRFPLTYRPTFQAVLHCHLTWIEAVRGHGYHRLTLTLEPEIESTRPVWCAVWLEHQPIHLAWRLTSEILCDLSQSCRSPPQVSSPSSAILASAICGVFIVLVAI